MLDEQLIKKEVQANRAASEEEKTKTIMSELIERQKNQKAIPTFFEEMSKGTVELDQKQYKTEKRKLFQDRINLIVFPEDIESYNVQDQMVVVIYKELEFSVNVYDAKTIMNPMQGEDYQLQIMKQVRECEMTYEPIESGELCSGPHSFTYASGIINSKEGYLFTMSFYSPSVSGIVGSFTSRLRKRFPYENLFRAMLEHFYV